MNVMILCLTLAESQVSLAKIIHKLTSSNSLERDKEKREVLYFENSDQEQIQKKIPPIFFS